MKKLIVLFPGIRYSTNMPLLYYGRLKYEEKGYEVLHMNYDNTYKEVKTLEEAIKYGKEYALNKLKDINFLDYDDVVFISKSMGTVVSGFIEEKLNINVRHIYLTPLNETLNYIKKGKNIIIVVSGTKDKHMDSEILKSHCLKENINFKLIEGANHRLEIKNDINKNIEILKEVVKLY